MKLMSPEYIKKKMTDYIFQKKETFKGSSCHFKTATHILDHPGLWDVTLLGQKDSKGNVTYVWHSFCTERNTRKTFDCNPSYTQKILKDKNMSSSVFEIENA